MSLVSKLQKKPHRVMGIDSSTNSLAFAIIEDDKLLEYGIINFAGNDIYEKLADCGRKTRAFANKWSVDYITIEASIAVRSVSVAMKLAYMNGAIMANLTHGGTRIIAVPPMAWQSYINNKVWSRAERAAFKKDNPGKTASWISTQVRKSRKQYTMDFVNNLYNINVVDDNVGDAIAIAYYSSKEMVS